MDWKQTTAGIQTASNPEIARPYKQQRNKDSSSRYASHFRRKGNYAYNEGLSRMSVQNNERRGVQRSAMLSLFRQVLLGLCRNQMSMQPPGQGTWSSSACSSFHAGTRAHHECCNCFCWCE